MDPNQGGLGPDDEDEGLPDTEPAPVPVCDRGGFSVTNADKDEDE